MLTRNPSSLHRIRFPILGLAMCCLSIAGCESSAAPTEDAFYGPPPEAPYSAESVRIISQDGRVLAGTLTLPGNGPAAVVVMVTGSGRQDRDEFIRGVGPSYRPFRQLADTLTRRGFATLRLDDPGVGFSDPYPPGATQETYAQDIRAAVRYLTQRSEIDSSRIVLLGHSEGAVVAPMAAAADSLVAGLVLLAAPAYTLERVNRFQRRMRFERDGLDPSRMESELDRTAQGAASEAATDPWRWAAWRYDPLPTARQIRGPVLLIHGEDDNRVGAEQSDTLAAAFREGGNEEVVVKKYPGINHFLLAAGSATGKGRVEQAILGAVADWVAGKFGSAVGG